MPRYYNLSPQGDGNNILLNSVLHNNITTYPRKGTVTTDRTGAAVRLPHYNLSPQGDGNHSAKCFFIIDIVITTYPRKGTETQQVQDLQVRQVQITTYPRKGTET